MSHSSTWHRLVDAIKPLRPAVRVKWSGDSEPTRWEPWIIISSVSYLETGTLGPVPFREVEWVEIDLGHRSTRGCIVEPDRGDWSDSVIEALRSADVPFAVVDGYVRVVGNNS